ncbi:MAG: macrolide ABC transporter ATP-binding protein [Sedimenticola sp.]|jgi:putative ABC transport system ATP-binding protein|nr:MAG: macrolide ABC transporter ATP-binding protein [Sedimenticola sp.]
MSNPLIEVRELYKTYALDGVEVKALRGIDLTIQRGEFVALMGSSGSGKSTLMNILGCLDVPDKGSYKLQGQDVTHMNHDQLAGLRNRDIGFVFQNFNLLPRTSALENVVTPLIYAGVGHEERQRRATEALMRMGLGDRMTSQPNQLSGGQQQRVAIARALVTQPSLLLADEPTGNLDSVTSNEIMDVLDALNREGMTILLITHEQEVAEHAHRTLVVRDGRLVESVE